jgi:hypothetical protein
MIIQFNSIDYLFIVHASINHPNVNYKVSMNKEGNNQTHTHKQDIEQGNLYDSYNNENSISANLPTIMLCKKKKKIHTFTVINIGKTAIFEP